MIDGILNRELFADVTNGLVDGVRGELLVDHSPGQSHVITHTGSGIVLQQAVDSEDTFSQRLRSCCFCFGVKSSRR